MRVASNIKIPIDELLDSVGIIYCEADKQTLINQPIIFNEKPIGIITKISEDGKYVEGLLWLEMGVECDCNIVDKIPVATEFLGIYIKNNTNEDIINFKNGSSIELIKGEGARGNRSYNRRKVK